MKLRFLFLTCTCFFSILSVHPQRVIEWQNSFGGTANEECRRIISCSDGGYLAAGSTASNDQQVTGNHGATDFWAVKTDAAGSLIWQKCYGGSDDDRIYDAIQTSDGGYIFAGPTSSNDGQVTGNQGYQDYWIVKVDSNGNLEWQKSFGGSLWDVPFSIQQTWDGGYIVAGGSTSNDGQITGNHGGQDFWIIKLDPSGNLIWQNALGGSGQDEAIDIQNTSDSGSIVCGLSHSNDGQVSGNHGLDDFWVVKLNSSGAIQWQRTYGGSNRDAAYSINQTGDGGYIVAGYTQSFDGQVSGNHGQYDIWVVKTNATGDLEWQQCFGGSGIEVAWEIQKIDDFSYILIGQTDSNNGQVSGNHGNQDYWVIRFTNSGDILWKECFGGSGDEDGLSIALTIDGKYILAGQSSSNDGQVSGNHGSFDFWVVKLADSGYISGTGDDSNKHILFNIYPSPTTGSSTLQLISGSDDSPIQVICYNMVGEMVFKQEFISGRKHELSLTDQAPGLYLLMVIQDGEKVTRTITKE
jgi:hypothetical protein